MDNKMITKKCSSCRKNKDISLFIKNGKELATCKKCLDTCKEYRKNNFEILKIRKKEYHNRNLKKEKARKHKYYLNNHDKLKKQQDKYYSIPKNREKLSKYKRKYYLENIDAIKKYHKDLYKNNKEEISEDRNIKYRLDIRRSLLCGAKGRAKKFNLPFSITIDDIIIPEKCPVFNIPIAATDKLAIRCIETGSVNPTTFKIRVAVIIDVY